MDGWVEAITLRVMARGIQGGRGGARPPEPADQRVAKQPPDPPDQGRHRLRRGDELVDTYGSLRHACEVLRAHAEEDLVLIERLLATVQDAELRAALESAKARKTRSLS